MCMQRYFENIRDQSIRLQEYHVLLKQDILEENPNMTSIEIDKKFEEENRIEED